MPSRFRVDTTADGLAVWWPWLSGHTLLLVVFYAAALTGGYFAFQWSASDPRTGDPRLGAVFRGGLLLAGAAATWGMSAAFLNRTMVRAGKEFLTVTHAPLYWPGGKRFPVADITGVTLSEERQSQEDGPDILTYRLRVELKSTYPRTLLDHLLDLNEATFLRNKLLGALGLPATG